MCSPRAVPLRFSHASCTLPYMWSLKTHSPPWHGVLCSISCPRESVRGRGAAPRPGLILPTLRGCIDAKRVLDCPVTAPTTAVREPAEHPVLALRACRAARQPFLKAHAPRYSSVHAPVECPVLALHAGCASAQELRIRYEGHMLSRRGYQAHQPTTFAAHFLHKVVLLHTCGTAVKNMQFMMYHSMHCGPCRHEGSESALCMDSMLHCYHPPNISTCHCFLMVVPLSAGSIRCSTPRPCARQRYRLPCAPFPGARQTSQASDLSPAQ